MTLETWMALWLTGCLIVYAIWARCSRGREKRKELKRLQRLIEGRKAQGGLR